MVGSSAIVFSSCVRIALYSAKDGFPLAVGTFTSPPGGGLAAAVGVGGGEGTFGGGSLTAGVPAAAAGVALAVTAEAGVAAPGEVGGGWESVPVPGLEGVAAPFAPAFSAARVSFS